MVCVCCAPQEVCSGCPDNCSFEVETSLDDAIGTSSVTATPTNCSDADCDDAFEADNQFYGSNTASTTANISPSGNINGSGRADEYVSGGGVSYSRFGSISMGLECEFGTNKWKVGLLLFAQSFQATEPFYPGIGFQKIQQTDAAYYLELEIGCADAIDDIAVVGDGDGVTINGTFYSWIVDSYTESCTELDGNLDPQPCADYLPVVIPEVTVTVSRRAGC